MSADLEHFGCDSHVHIVGDPSLYPMSPDRHYTPGQATREGLAEHLARVGLARTVLVQPSIYGTDNRCLLDALGALGNRARAVAVLDRDVGDAQLVQLDRQGVRGIRVNLESVGTSDAAQLARELQYWASRIADHGWHIQIFVPKRMVAACASTIAALAVPCVADHIAMWDDAACNDDDSRTVLRLLETGKLYIKLSASYRVPLEAAALRGVIDRLIQTRSDRLLWASDWPHTSRRAGAKSHDISPYRSVSSADLVFERTQWLQNDRLLKQVCVTTPHALYRF